MSRFVSLPLLACSLLLPACRMELPEPSTASRPKPLLVSAQRTPATTPSYAEAQRPGPRETTLSLSQIEGANVARARSAFAQLRGRVQECAPGSSGVLHVRIQSSPDRTRMTLEPGSVLDERRRHCVLETLSRVDVDGIWSNASPSDRPSGFSALLRIEW